MLHMTLSISGPPLWQTPIDRFLPFYPSHCGRASEFNRVGSDRRSSDRPSNWDDPEAEEIED